MRLRLRVDYGSLALQELSAGSAAKDNEWHVVWAKVNGAPAAARIRLGETDASVVFADRLLIAAGECLEVDIAR